MERTFVFDDYEEIENGEVIFRYRIKSDVDELVFTEKLIFPHADFSQIPEPLRHRLHMNLLLILGISYWKLYCPKKIEIKNNQLTEEQANFWNSVYMKGLGEFFYKNNIDFRGPVQFPHASGFNAEPVSLARKDRMLLMLGGGKDSIVSAELLKENKKDFTAFVINDYPLQQEIVKLIGVDSIIVKREIDPKLLKINGRSGVYNGHVPISAIYAFIALMSAALYDYRYIVSSNEKSANFGNVEYLGIEINHQWSKSFEFEQMFQNYVKQYITDDIDYFSLLRPMHEIKIAQLFSKYPKYFSTFSSCNRNFTIQKTTDKKWCGDCSKCAFVFTMLATFLSKEEVIKIFGKNLFADATLIHTYKELLGIKDIKPFECVGTPDEVKLAFYLAHKKGEFGNDVVIQMFKKFILPKMTNTEELKKELLSGESIHFNNVHH